MAERSTREKGLVRWVLAAGLVGYRDFPRPFAIPSSSNHDGDLDPARPQAWVKSDREGENFLLEWVFSEAREEIQISEAVGKWSVVIKSRAARQCIHSQQRTKPHHLI